YGPEIAVSPMRHIFLSPEQRKGRHLCRPFLTSPRRGLSRRFHPHHNVLWVRAFQHHEAMSSSAFTPVMHHDEMAVTVRKLGMNAAGHLFAKRAAPICDLDLIHDCKLLLFRRAGDYSAGYLFCICRKWYITSSRTAISSDSVRPSRITRRAAS